MPDQDPSLIPMPTGLTEEQVEAALRGEIDSPVLSVLQGYEELLETHEADATGARNALVGDLIEASPYQLDIQTLIAIWAYGVPDPETSGMPRGVSVPLIAVYVLHEPELPQTEELVKSFVDEGRLNPGIHRDEEYNGRARARMSSMSEGLRRLSEYMYGVSNQSSTAFELSQSDDPDDRNRLRAILAQEEHRHPLLSELKDNVTNITVGLSFALDE